MALGPIDALEDSVIQSSSSWVGRTIDDCHIESQFADGAFSWIYRARENYTDRIRLFKVAKPEQLIHQDGLDPFCTQSLAITDGDIKLVKPNTNALLTSQHSRLYPRLDSGLVRVGKLHVDSGRSYFSMEYLGKTNLRQHLQTEKMDISIFANLACQLAEIRKPHKFQYHGDLKPENIMVTGDGIKAIDPGYFGAMESEQGESLEVAVTTSWYYPFLKPDDLFAFGLIFWEAVLKMHPLYSIFISTANRRIDGQMDSRSSDLTISNEDVIATFRELGYDIKSHSSTVDSYAVGLFIAHFNKRKQQDHPLEKPKKEQEEKPKPVVKASASVREWIGAQAPAARLLLSPLLHLPRPSDLQPGISPILEQVLLKGLRMRIDPATNEVVIGPGFESFAQWFQILTAMPREIPVV